jgi:hypothetical protein
MTHPRDEINEHRRRRFGTTPERRVAFVCECGEVSCRRAVVLTAAEFDRLRAAGGAVLVDSSHKQPESHAAE